jgi:hypothetical protein
VKRGTSVVRPIGGSRDELQGSGDHAPAGRSAGFADPPEEEVDEQEDKNASLPSLSFRSSSHAYTSEAR